MKKYVWIFVTALFVLAGSCFSSALAEQSQLDLYVAAGLKKPMDVIIEKFKKENENIKVVANYASSGSLYAQIRQGQPCDLYFSADWLYIEKIQQDKKLAEGFKFLTDHEVLIVSRTGESKVKSVKDLTKKGVVLVLADPQAPNGAYAERALRNLGIWEEINSAGILKARPSTVHQVALMVKEDQADAAIIFRSVAKAHGLKTVETISTDLTGEIIFAAAVIKDEDEKLARQFYDFARRHVEEFTKYGWQPYE
ncbi:MAG: molybdate ABC transporter substrate-binding protein [Deltaproteobacteria bacterium]|nr:molybdate ABC transporter substrate-binding protein [Deltaproteobacteria bacterium]